MPWGFFLNHRILLLKTLLFLVDPNQLMLKNSECMLGMLASALEPEAGILLAVRMGAPGSWLLTDSALNPCCSSYWPASFVSGWSGEHSTFPTASGVTELSRDCLTLILSQFQMPREDPTVSVIPLLHTQQVHTTSFLWVSVLAEGVWKLRCLEDFR